MITVLLTFHVLVVLGLIGVVLLQRSDGGALGIGGGGGGGFMTGRGAANALTRTTSILAAVFFATSITLAIISDRGETDQDVLQGLTGQEVRDPNAPLEADDLLRTLGGEAAPEAPVAAPESSPEAATVETPAESAPETSTEETAEPAAETEAPREPQPE